MSGLKARILEDEIMDQPGLDEGAHRRALRGLCRVNRISGIDRLLWKALREFRLPKNGDPLRILDLACGGGDVSLRLARRAAKAGLAMTFSGTDKSETAIQHAASQAVRFGLSNIDFFCQDALNDPLERVYDVVMCTLFMHHLDESQAVQLLRRMEGGARQGILLDDLRRTRVGYAMAWCGVRILSRSPMVHFDGPQSVRAAFRVEEVKQLAQQAGLEQVQIRRHWPQRFLLTWKRPEC